LVLGTPWPPRRRPAKASFRLAFPSPPSSENPLPNLVEVQEFIKNSDEIKALCKCDAEIEVSNVEDPVAEQILLSLIAARVTPHKPKGASVPVDRKSSVYPTARHFAGALLHKDGRKKGVSTNHETSVSSLIITVANQPHVRAAMAKQNNATDKRKRKKKVGVGVAAGAAAAAASARSNKRQRRDDSNPPSDEAGPPRRRSVRLRGGAHV